MASAAVMSKKRAAAAELDTLSLKKPRFDDAGGVWNTRSPADNTATPSLDSPSSSQESPTVTERAESVAESSITSASSSKRPKNYICNYEECGKAFDRPIRLQMHIRSHTNERPFPCTEAGCDKSFLRNEHLKAHIKAKHNDDRSYVCTYKIHNTENGLEEECGKGFHTATRLRRHVAMHEEKEQTRCQDCGKEFRKQETLQRHIKSVHLNEKAFRCTHIEAVTMDEECGETFSNPRQLKAHEARSHSGARYFCHICVPTELDDNAMDEGDDNVSLQTSQVGFPSYAELQAHIKIVHPPTCATCGKACETNKALMAHMDIEHSSLTDRQRFECTEPGCGRKFTKAGNMKVHVQTVHAKTKKFVCGEFDLAKSKKVEGWQGPGCGYSFGTKANLEEHVRTQHLNMPGTTRPSQMNTSKSNSRLQSPALRKTDDAAASLLTGYGYEKDRPIACLEQNCPQRFMRNFDLETHMDMVHQWIIDDIEEAIRERDAREGGKFWIGGGEELEAEEDREFRRLLVEGLQLGNQSTPVVGNGLNSFLQESATNSMDISGGQAIDPALSGL